MKLPLALAAATAAALATVQAQVIWSSVNNTQPINVVVFAGNYIFTASQDASIQKLSLATGASVQALLAHQKSVNALLVNGTSIFSCSDDSMIIQWDIASGTQLNNYSVNAPTSNLKSLALVGQYIYAGSDDSGFSGALYQVNLATGAWVSSAYPPTSAILSLKYYGGNLFAGCQLTSDSYIYTYNASTLVQTSSLLHNSATQSITISGSTLYAGLCDSAAYQQSTCSGGSIEAWNIPGGSALFTWNVYNSEPINAIFLNGGYMYVATTSSILRQYNSSTGAVINAFSGHTSEVNSIAISGGLMVTGSDDLSVKLWNLTVPVVHSSTTLTSTSTSSGTTTSTSTSTSTFTITSTSTSTSTKTSTSTSTSTRTSTSTSTSTRTSTSTSTSTRTSTSTSTKTTTSTSTSTATTTTTSTSTSTTTAVTPTSALFTSAACCGSPAAASSNGGGSIAGAFVGVIIAGIIVVVGFPVGLVLYVNKTGHLPFVPKMSEADVNDLDPTKIKAKKPAKKQVRAEPELKPEASVVVKDVAAPAKEGPPSAS